MELQWKCSSCPQVIFKFLACFLITPYAHTISNHPQYQHNFLIFTIIPDAYQVVSLLAVYQKTEYTSHSMTKYQVSFIINLSSAGNFVVLSSCDHVYVTRNHCLCVGNFWLSIFRKLQVVMECMEGGELFDRISIKVWLLKYSQSKQVLSKFRFSSRS